MKKIVLFIASAIVATADAKIVLPDLISDNMVLQQQTSATLWGKATPKSAIEIKGSWSEEIFKATTRDDSTWQVKVATPKASFTPQTIVITETGGKHANSVKLGNVLIGEVWYAGGQSNMEMPLSGFWNCPVGDASEEIATASEWASKIRMATVPKTGAVTPQEWVNGCKWQVPSPSTAKSMSATAWFYAQMMERVLQVPVGILTVAWGGSSVEGWTPREILSTYKDIDIEKELKRGWNGRWWEWYTPLIMYNGMLHPVRHYTIRGFIWYQGEANVGKDTYFDRMKTMIRVFRNEFGGTPAQLPFYLTEIAPWEGYGEWNSAPELRDAQHRLGREVENAGCIITNDLVESYEARQIHPHEKRQVGYRLAWMALNRTYGMKEINTDYPEYDHSTASNDTVRLFFKRADNGFSRMDDIRGFEIAGADGKYYPAKAIVKENDLSVYVFSKDVAEPWGVRYGYRAFMPDNLQSTYGLPVVPFKASVK